jgi:hypothetical protein
VNAQSDTPAFLLIVRESLRPESVEAYNENELQLATACATLNCPHPYLALTTAGEANEVWWLNAFASVEQKDGLSDAYASNEPLMNVLERLGKRKEDFRTSLTTSVAKYAESSSDDVAFRMASARFVVVGMSTKQPQLSGAVFETDDGVWFVFRTAASLDTAQEIAASFGSGAKILAIQPRWSFPDRTWVDADPEFWSSSPAAREPLG